MTEDTPDPPAETTRAPPGPRKPRVAVLLTFLGVFVLLLFLFRSVLFPFLMAIYVAYLVEPIVRAVTKSPIFGIKWARGPTIVAIYVVVIGGMSVLGWIGITKLAQTVRRASSDIAASLSEAGHRVEFELLREEEADPGTWEPLSHDVVIPRGTSIRLADGVHKTLYDVRIEAGQRSAHVLLEHPRKRVPRTSSDEAAFADPSEVRDGDDEALTDDTASRLLVRATPATGLEYFAERSLISPIVRNLGDWGYEVEPTLVREFVRIKAETLKADLPGRLGKGALSVAGKLVLSVYMFFLILMLTAFIVMDRKGIAKFFASLPPPEYAPHYQRLVRYIDDGLAGVIRGQLVICAVNGVLTYLGLLVLGVPYALLLSAVAAVLSLIPVFGTIVSTIPIVLVAATDGIGTGVLALGWVVMIHLIEANVLNPVIMGSHARMHPLIIIFALLAGEHGFGVWGALLAVPTMSIIQSCFRYYLHEIDGLPVEPEAEHRNWLSTLWRKLKGRAAGPKPEAGEGGSS